jgi:hypothetical protein
MHFVDHQILKAQFNMKKTILAVMDQEALGSEKIGNYGVDG